MDYLQISKEDIESWEESPEEYMTEEKQEVWKYDVRPCSEVLVLSLVHHYQAPLVPQLVNMVSEVQEVILPKIDGSNKNDPNVLIADAVLNAIGLTSYELSDQVDFDSWFTSTLGRVSTTLIEGCIPADKFLVRYENHKILFNGGNNSRLKNEFWTP